MKLSQFKFNLDKEQVALYPHNFTREFTNDDGTKETLKVTRRDESRLMVLHKKSGQIDMFKKDADGKPIEGEYLDFRNILNSAFAHLLDLVYSYIFAISMSNYAFNMDNSAFLNHFFSNACSLNNI